MANGHGRNLSRLMIVLESFRELHGHWPQRVRLEQGYIDDFRYLLTENGYQQLVNKLSLVPDSLNGIRAEDDLGNTFTYGFDPMPDVHREINAAEWLGKLDMNLNDDDPF